MATKHQRHREKKRKERAMAELMEAWKLKNKNEDWKSDALCREYKEIRWFPHRGYNHTNSAQAKEICGRCMVREECLQYSLDNMFPAGIWGGKTADERLQILGLKGWGVTTK